MKILKWEITKEPKYIKFFGKRSGAFYKYIINVWKFHIMRKRTEAERRQYSEEMSKKKIEVNNIVDALPAFPPIHLGAAKLKELVDLVTRNVIVKKDEDK